MMQKWKGLAGWVAAVTAASCLVQTAAAASSSYIVETFDTVVEESCLEYQPYDDAGKLVISLNQDMRTYVTVKQLSQEKEFYVFYDLDLQDGETTYVMPLEAGEYEVTIGVPYTKNSEKIMEHTETITIENPDFNLDLQSTTYHYTLWKTEKALESPALLEENKTEQNQVNTVYQAYQFQQVSGLKGDVDEDGMVSVNDAVMLLTYYAKSSAGLQPNKDATYQSIFNGDIDGDKLISVNDAVAVLTYYAKSSAGLKPDWSNLS